MEVFTQAGFTINLKKSDLTPSQDLVYIGGRFRTDLGMVFLPQDRLEALVRAVRSFSRVGALHPAQLWLQLLLELRALRLALLRLLTSLAAWSSWSATTPLRSAI